MSDTIISPIFKLNFEQTDGTFTDLTGNGYDATATPATAVTPVANDPEMGRCLQFAGTTASFCKISEKLSDIDISNGLTMTEWINIKAYTATPMLLQIGYGAKNIGMQLGSGKPYYWNSQTMSKSLESSTVLPLDSWQHVAVTADTSGKVTLYINGQENKQGTSSDFIPVSGDTIAGIFIGNLKFNGMMAWAALYDGPLEQADILADMAEGQAKRTASFRQSTPIDFKLYSDDGGAESPIMYIEDAGTGEDLNLRIVNNSLKPISISKSTNPVSKANYHFQLHFRPGVLSKNFLSDYSEDSTAPKPTNLPELLANMTDNTGWKAVVNGDTASTNTISFLYQGDSPLSIAKGEDLPIVVSAVNASATGGSRNTNVELRYANIQLGAATMPITGHRKQNISIVNHSGEKEIPLRAEIVGNASVMTYAKPADGSQVANPPETDLMFRIVNTGIKPLPLALPVNNKGETKFTLSIDIQPQNHLVEWALVDQGATAKLSVELNKLGVIRKVTGSTIVLEGPLIEPLAGSTSLIIGRETSPYTVASAGALAGAYEIPMTTSLANVQPGVEIQLASSDTTWKTPTGPDTGTPPDKLQWTITNQSVTTLAPGAGLSFLLKGVECSLPAGSSVVTISYLNVPGHWEGQFELPVEKSPIAFNQNLIGINTQDPAGSLHIEEKNSFTPLIIGKKSPLTIDAQFTVKDFPETSQLLPLFEPGSYYDPTLYYNNSGELCLYIYNLKNGQLSLSKQALPQIPASANTPGRPGGTAIFSGGWLYVPSYDTNENGEIYTYHFTNTPPVPVYYKKWQTESGGVQYWCSSGFVNNNYLYLLASDQDHSGAGEFYIVRFQGLPTGSHLPDLSIVDTPFSSANTPIIAFSVQADQLFTFRSGAASGSLFEIYSINTDGSLVKAGQITISQSGLARNNDHYIYNKVFYYQNNNQGLSAIDISDPSNPRLVYNDNTQFFFTEWGGGAEYAFYQGYFLTAPNKVYNITDPTGPQLIQEVSWLSVSSFSICDGNILVAYTSGGTSYNSGFTFEYFFNLLFGHSTFISSKTLSVGTKTPLENMPLAVNDSSGKIALSVIDNGYVGIGTNDPKVPLHVVGGPNYATSGAHTFLNHLKPSSTNEMPYIGHSTSSMSPYTSIVATAVIQATGFIANSDIRIKELKGKSASGSDLATLLNLNITDYEHIDFIQHGTSQKKGLIAQQVKEVFPQAVNDQNTDFIPDIYAMATDVGWQPVTKHLSVSLDKTHDIEVGDRVRLIAEKGFEEKEVVAVPDDKSFVVAEWEKPVEKLFVFGKEVHDFHTVDYDQVAMLGVSAIQALHAEVESLKKENEALKTQIQSEMAELKAEWAAFKSSITKQYQN